jgi:hypothetical protein
MLLYWKTAGKLTGYSRIQSQSYSLNKCAKKYDLNWHEMMLWQAGKNYDKYFSKKIKLHPLQWIE